MPDLFTFLECLEVEPICNYSEHALCYTVVLCKISGQIKGGSRSMGCMPNPVTCIMT